MKIMGSKVNQVWCTIEYIKQHHEYHKHESLCLTTSLFLDITCNIRHKFRIRFVGIRKVSPKKLHAKKGKKIACVKPYERI
jgi:hypothetical protein